jgi:plasmid stability protein
MIALIASRIMARTTLDIDPSILRQLRIRGKRERKSMGQVASELLASALTDSERPAAAKLDWTTANLGTPRVELEDKEALRRVLDEPT